MSLNRLKDTYDYQQSSARIRGHDGGTITHTELLNFYGFDFVDLFSSPSRKDGAATQLKRLFKLGADIHAEVIYGKSQDTIPGVIMKIQ